MSDTSITVIYHAMSLTVLYTYTSTIICFYQASSKHDNRFTNVKDQRKIKQVINNI